ncbi:MAG TPA: hypothetical protein VF028_10640 [Actinomycetota bacterium]|nr:hypothetical protein [Actinomycetota bacterium]
MAASGGSGETPATGVHDQMLPARRGDALLVQYGPTTRRADPLDGGTPTWTRIRERDP